MPQFVSPNGIWAADADCDGRVMQMTQKQYMGFVTLFNFLAFIASEVESGGFGPHMHKGWPSRELSSAFRTVSGYECDADGSKSGDGTHPPTVEGSRQVQHTDERADGREAEQGSPVDEAHRGYEDLQWIDLADVTKLLSAIADEADGQVTDGWHQVMDGARMIFKQRMHERALDTRGEARHALIALNLIDQDGLECAKH